MICTEVAYERKRNYNKIDNSWCNSYDYLLNCSPMCMNGEILDWRKLLLFVDFLRNPENVFAGCSKKCGDRGNACLLVLKLMVGSLIGIGGSCLEIISW